MKPRFLVYDQERPIKEEIVHYKIVPTVSIGCLSVINYRAILYRKPAKTDAILSENMKQAKANHISKSRC